MPIFSGDIFRHLLQIVERTLNQCDGISDNDTCISLKKIFCGFFVIGGNLPVAHSEFIYENELVVIDPSIDRTMNILKHYRSVETFDLSQDRMQSFMLQDLKDAINREKFRMFAPINVDHPRLT